MTDFTKKMLLISLGIILMGVGFVIAWYYQGVGVATAFMFLLWGSNLLPRPNQPK